MLIGLITAKVEIIVGETRRKLASLLLYVTTPCLVITAFQFEFFWDRLQGAGLVALTSVIIHFSAILLGNLLYRKSPPERGNIMRYILVFSNSGFMGLPLLASLYGSAGVFFGSVYNLLSDVFMWTFGITLFGRSEQRPSTLKILVNPGTISVLAGLVLFLFSLKLPGPIFQAMEMVGGMTAPLSMLIIGALLGESELRHVFTGREVYYSALFRLLLIPLAVTFVLRAAGLPAELLQVSVALVAMPAAANTVIFAEQFGGDSALASRCVVFSTLLSILTIPLMMLIASAG